MVNSKRMLKTALLAGAAISGLVAMVPVASAQSADNPYLRNRFTAVTDRFQPEFDPEARRLGSMLLSGNLGLGVRQDSNIFASSTNEVDDTVLYIAPNFMLGTDWANHEIYASVNAENRQYANNDDESATDVTAQIGGRLDVTRDFKILGRAGIRNGVEPRYAPASISGYAKQAEFNNSFAEISAELNRDRLRLEAGVGRNSEDLDSVPLVGGGTLDLNFRDYDSTYVRGRASYAISPNIAYFVQARTEKQDYVRAGTAALPDRDLDRTVVLTGVNFELAAPFRGEIGVGYVKENKFGSAADFDGFSANASLNWFITELTTLTFGAVRDVYDPGIPLSRTLVSTRWQVRADHEFARNILGFASLETEKRDFQDITRTDDLFTGSFGVAYKVNKRARVEASYSRRDLQTNSNPLFAQDFNQNVFSIGLKLYP